MSEQTLSNLSREERRFEPPADLAASAYEGDVQESAASSVRGDAAARPGGRGSVVHRRSEETS
ncbi:hypothetical protein [Nocardioides pinisoli]|uniref:Uncharacterized protein n=1 Tax=Nocardioides pinisoli TaxID=2950279 RepID=A0ABT1L3Q0_9ACTN|nr:hypothetical protein [Nocardioides pinisoli]MCP3424319.1 hypothetical protein [Nocardioides pinisoli]